MGEPKPPKPPSAELVGLQFGLATTNDLVGYSVIKTGCNDSIKTLVDPRLGLPSSSEDENCGTCGGTNYEECAGHFAHVRLSQPILHPNHTRLLLHVLQAICVACGVPKAKKKKSIFCERWKLSSGDFVPEVVNEGREQQSILEAESVERCGPSDRVVIDVSSDEDDMSGILRVASAVPPGPQDFRVDPGSPSQSSAMTVPKSKGKAHASGSTHLEFPQNGSKKSAIGAKKYVSLTSLLPQNPGKFSEKMYKGRPAGFDVLDPDTLQTATSAGSSGCKHCSPMYPDYRPINVKVLPMKGRKQDDKFEIVVLEVEASKKKEDDWLPDDFWAFLDGKALHKDRDAKVPLKRVLSPSEALTILKKIPEKAIDKLGMDREVARPEGLILKCVPIPPNCTRTPDYKHVNNTTVVRFGTDDVTRALQNLVNEIIHIHKTRFGKAMNKAQRDESIALQILTAEYLREKGAPKAVPGAEPPNRDRNGRVTKHDDHRWTKEWLSEHLLAKGGNYTAKAVLTGDPSMNIEDIGVPWVIAQKLTMSERASRLNRSKLQEYVNRSQALETGPDKPGALRIERDGQAFQVFPNSTHKVQIGDVVHRNIQDGDYIFVNRPPSVHKHSLMALKVRIHHELVITINPLICPPFGADFDGDIFHIYVPQSLQAMAEVEQLIAVPQQVVSEHGGQPLLALTQDTLMAAYLLTNTKVFVDKPAMDQLGMWSSKLPPTAAILKSPKGGPFWTGEQVFGLTLPSELNLESPDGSVLIQDGEITKWSKGANLLRKEKGSIAEALCLQLGPQALVDYLNNATGLLHAWLQGEGFSTGLADFQVTTKSAERKKMLQRIFEEYYQKSIDESCNSVRILGPDQTQEAMGRGPQPIVNSDSLTKNIRVLEQAAQQIFRKREVDAEKVVLEYAQKDNPLMLMVKSGSKGSRGKLLQQIAGMGLQLFKGKHLLPLAGSHSHPPVSDDPMLNWWKERGLVQSSLVDGLTPAELFSHVVADRTSILRKHVEVTQPGILFKSLMLFLRDLHVSYDGTVRSHGDKNLVQFCYGGAEALPKPTGEWEEDDRKRLELSRLAGEPVGVLAATAISQPAYEVMLDAPSLSGPFNPRPLDLVQETLYPRAKTDLKQSDRCVIIRLGQCLCTKPHCLEKSVLAVHAYLSKVTLRTLAESAAIQYWNMEGTSIPAGPSGDAFRFGSPWLGHIKLSLDMMEQHNVSVEDIEQRLRDKYSANIKNPKRNPMGQLFFSSSLDCSISNGRACLHFSPRLPKNLQNEPDDDIYNATLLALLMKIKATIIPGLLDSTVKGDERLESVRIVSEGPTRTTSHRDLLPTWHNNLGEELVLEIIVAPTSRSDRGMAWTAVMEACLPFMELVDWNRSMPYSIQEIRHTMGVEVAYETVKKRLRAVLENTAPHTHPNSEKLIADAMTFSGNANGFNIYGFQDMLKSTKVSAPFTEASFRKPLRTLFEAAGRGAIDSVEGVMTNCVWGKEAPLGTGCRFDVLWQPSKVQRRSATVPQAKEDVHAILKDLAEKCIPDQIIPLSPPPSLPGLRILPAGGDLDLDDGAGFSPQHAPNGDNADDMWGSSKKTKNGDDGAWGDSPVATVDDGEWGSVGKASNGNDPAGGWDQDETGTDGIKEQEEVEEQDAWGSLSKEKNTSGGTWGETKNEEIQGGWEGGSSGVAGNEGGWADEGDGSDEGKLQPDGDDRNDGVENKVHTTKNSSEGLGGWESGNQGEGNSTTWGTDPVQETGVGGWARGWGSGAPEVAEDDGWNSLAGSSQIAGARQSTAGQADQASAPKIVVDISP
ncbi:hypothetical protein KC19_10G053800 [Ceratodon purpureus]|uniref:DNA-directed RNA polymerase subunit n=1 Tax=Ceratodon purpureus TaxID=3225 RepID=A0A8T0GKR3_CERPU|nr:hypothetical protein KC19_10G053800 [Ceratodon purpureus]